MYAVTQKKKAGMRSKGVEKRLKMYKSKIRRDAKGNIISGGLVKDLDELKGRIAPNRRFFENTRVIAQKDLTNFREEMSKKMDDPYSVVVKQKKLPTQLLKDRFTNTRAKILDVEPFDRTFGKISTRKKPKLASFSMDEMVAKAADRTAEFAADPTVVEANPDDPKAEGRFWSLKAGQSKRILSEFYKVVDSSDVLVQVLDARDPMGTRSAMVERYMKTDENKHRKLLFVLNKCDLVPSRIAKGWLATLSKEYPTVAFQTSLKHNKEKRKAKRNKFGIDALLSLLRQMPRLFPDRKTISVGFIGYPNTGKSSVINTLKQKDVCKVAPIPGETKVWQYITLTAKIYLIDCPGVVSPDPGLSDGDIVLRGVVRVENIDAPEQYMADLLAKVPPAVMAATYKLEDRHYTPEELLEAVARQSGRLLKGGEPDFNSVARQMIADFVRGKIPWFMEPPMRPGKGPGAMVEEEKDAEEEEEVKEQ